MRKNLGFILLTMALLHSPLRAETKMEGTAVTGDDLVRIQNLNVQKLLLTFDTPQYVALHWTSMGMTRTVPLKKKTKTLSFMTYLPREGGNIRPLNYWLTVDNGDSLHSSIMVEANKIKTTITKMENKVFTITAYETDTPGKIPLYKIEVLTSEKEIPPSSTP